ncbi:MAG: hypothetical protein KZY74_08285 [Paenibacillaceae bacterium]|nr:hypothetical protein [Paenibacillaceae bacterium]
MNEHLSRMDRYGQQNRVKRSSSATSWNLSSGIAAAEPVPEPTVVDIQEEVAPPANVEKKPAIGDETMIGLLIPRVAAPEDRGQGKVTHLASKSELAKWGKAGDTKFQSAAVAALAKLKEPVQQPLPISPPGSEFMREGEKLDEGQELLLAVPNMEPDVESMPTRKELFPSQRLKMTRWFYNSLLYIFVIILIYLLWWGVSDSPWGKSHGL